MPSTLERIRALPESVSRLERGDIPANAHITPDNKEWYKGLFDAAQNMRDPRAVNDARAHIEASLRAGKAGLSDGIANTQGMLSCQDATVPTHHLISINPQITMAPESRHPTEDIDLQAMRADVPRDWRAKYFQRWEASYGGNYNRYCCGVDPTGVTLDIKPRTEKASWYTSGFQYCWMDAAEQSYAGLIDEVAAKMMIVKRQLDLARIETFFFGDPQVGIRGLQQVFARRITLGTPLDQMATFDDPKNFLQSIPQNPLATRGDIAIPYDSMLSPHAFKIMLSDEPPTGANSCCDNLGKKIAPLWSGIQNKSTDYMNFMGAPANGRPHTPAIFLYNRRQDFFRRLMATNIIFLPPCMENGNVKIQGVLKVGSVYTTDPNAGLMISNAFTGPNDYL